MTFELTYFEGLICIFVVGAIVVMLLTGYSKRADVKSTEISSEQLVRNKNTEYSSEYAYNLNVIYFVAKDKVVNDHYKERLSQIFMETQKFFNKWMLHWGYGDITFGLFKNEAKSRIKIHTIYGSRPLLAYSNNMQAMVDEIERYFVANPGARSGLPTMVMIPFNERSKVGQFVEFCIPPRAVPGYGFAIEHPEQNKEHVETEDTYRELTSRERAEHDNGVRHTRKMLYELGHAMGLIPHRGSKSHPVEEVEKMRFSLMGIEGRESYARFSTFLTYFDATILAHSQLFSKEITSYDEETGAEITSISKLWNKEGDEYALQGIFRSSAPVTHISFRLRAESDIIGNNSVIWTLSPEEGSKFVLRVAPWELLRYSMANDANAHLQIIFHHTSGVLTSKSYRITYDNILGDGEFESD